MTTEIYLRNNEKRPITTLTEDRSTKKGFPFWQDSNLHSKSSLLLSKSWNQISKRKYFKLKSQHFHVFLLVLCILRSKNG